MLYVVFSYVGVRGLSNGHICLNKEAPRKMDDLSDIVDDIISGFPSADRIEILNWKELDD